MNEIYKEAMDDLDILNDLSKKLVDKMPPDGSMVNDELYLQNASIQIFIISQLEYFLKKNNIIQEREQYKIPNIIKKSSLRQIEKDHLIFLFLVRHTLIHNGGHCDSKFIKEIDSDMKELKLRGFKEGLLSSVDPKLLSLHIELVKKLIDELRATMFQ